MKEGVKAGGRPLLCIVDPSLKDFVGHHFEYDAAVASGASQAGYDTVCLAHRNVGKAVSDVLSVKPTFTYDIWGARQAYADRPPEAALEEANRSFLADLTRATSDLALDERTIIFGHMITAAQLGGWAAFARTMRARKATIVLLCRYELAHYRGEAASRAFRELERLKQAGVRIRLASDSQRLARHFARLTSLPVEVFPIPHTQGHQPAGLAEPAWNDARLVVSMLGNARDEKGWVELLAAVQVLLAQGRAQHFRFVVQANDPDAACREALCRMGEELSASLDLKTQALEPPDYATLLRDSDIVVLPYWRSIYEARTSGVLVEALSAGKPVICTEATWLSDQIDAGQGRSVKDRNPADLARQLWAMRTDYAQYAEAAAQARAKWVAYHNPTSFIAALTKGVRPEAPDGLRVALFYPWGDAQQRASGASLRLNLLARYLTARVEGVTILEDSRHGADTIDGVRFEAHPLLEAGDASNFGRQLRKWTPRLFGVTDGEEVYLLLHLYPSFDKEFRRRLEEIVRSSDIVFLEYAFWAPVLSAVCRDLGKPLVITAHDVVADQVRSSRFLRWLTGQLELYGLRKARGVAVVSAADQATFARHGVRTTVIPQFVDVDGLRAMPKVERAVLNRLIELPETDRAALFVFVGSRFGPNQTAAARLHEMAAATRTKHPDLAFHIVVAGSCHAPVREDAFIALGRVDEATLATLYQHATAVVIPLTLGTGASLKTVEALGAGAPVLGTSIAFRGFVVTPGVNCILEDDLSAWPDRLAELAGDSTLGQRLRTAARQLGEGYDYRNTCRGYLALAPEIKDVSVRETGRAAANRKRAVMALVRAGWEAGAGEAVRPYLEDLRSANPDDCVLAQIEAELLSNGDPAEVGRAGHLFREAFEAGGEIEPNLYGLFKASERLGDRLTAAQTTSLAARLLSLQAVHQGGDAAVREALWKRFHAGDRTWVHAIARAFASLGPSAHMDYHYLFSLLETGENADNELGLRHAERALAAGFDRYWSLSLIARHQAALGQTSNAIETLARATDAAADEEQRHATISARLVIVWDFFNRRELSEAYDEASRLLIDVPSLSGAYYLRAECLRLMGTSFGAAIADYERAEQLGYDPSWCRLHSGRLLTEAGRFEEAGKRLIGAFPGLQDPHKIQCWRDGMAEIARLGLGQLNLSDLRELITEAVSLDPENFDLEARLRTFGVSPTTISSDSRLEHLERLVGATFQKGDYRLVLAIAREANALYPQDPIFVYYIGECLQILNQDLDLAELQYSRALDLSMAPFWPLMNRAQVRRKLGRFQEARYDLEAALQTARTEPEHAQVLEYIRDLESGRQLSSMMDQ